MINFKTLASLSRGVGTCAAVCLSLALGACSTNYTATEELNASPTAAHALLIDAKQRAILTNAPKGVSAGQTALRICAEPSPDALSTIAASNNIGLKTKGDIDLTQAMSLAESGGSFGLRTQSITLMRDEMYRACELYMDGAIDGASWEIMHRRSQNLMIATLAIEQLTGAVRARQIVLGGSASTGNADAVLKLTDATEAARASAIAAEGEHDAAQTDVEAAQKTVTTKEAAVKSATGDEAIAAAQADLDAAKADLEAKKKTLQVKDAVWKNKQAAFDSVDRSRIAALNGQTTSSANGSFADGGNQLDPVTASNLSSDIKDIVEKTLDQTYSRELCVTVLLRIARGELPDRSPVAQECLLFLHAGNLLTAADGGRFVYKTNADFAGADIPSIETPPARMQPKTPTINLDDEIAPPKRNRKNRSR